MAQARWRWKYREPFATLWSGGEVVGSWREKREPFGYARGR